MCWAVNFRQHASRMIGMTPVKSMLGMIAAWSCGVMVVAGADGAPDARIDVTRGRLADRPAAEVRARVKALGGQSLKVTWLLGADVVKQQKPVTIHISRVTATRRVSLAEVKLEALAEEVPWAWEVPLVKGPARYEATLDLPVPVVLVIEAGDRASHEAALKSLAACRIMVTGAKETELAALRLLGMKPTAAGAATGAGEVILLIEGNADGGSPGWRRELRLAADSSADVVWVSGPGPNDWRVRVPRFWISPEALALPEGRLRLTECLTDPPPVP